MSYLEKYTVAQLRDIAARMEIKHTTKTRKPELIQAIDALIYVAHADAHLDDKTRRPIELLPDFEMTVAMTDAARADNYRRQNGSNKLTQKQQRRLRKKAHRRLGRELAKMVERPSR